MAENQIAWQPYNYAKLSDSLTQKLYSVTLLTLKGTKSP